MNTKEDIIQWHKDHPYGARDSEYMDLVLDEVKRRWLESPGERLGQLLENIAGPIDLFFWVDEDLFE